MDFLFKSLIKSLCLIVVISFHLTSASEQLSFLFPDGEDDPLKLRPFLQKYYPPLGFSYGEIQEAKAAADTERLLELKDNFQALKPPENGWNDLISRLKKEVAGDIIELWPEQTAQCCLGSVLFYPHELIHNPEGDDTIYSYPGVAASLAISAYFGNPLAIYELSKDGYSGYLGIGKEFREPPCDYKSQEERSSEDQELSTLLKARAMRLFAKASGSPIAQIYVTKDAYYREDGLSDKKFINRMQKINHPLAFFELGRLYENKRGASISKKRKKGASSLDSNKENAYQYYRRALEGGYEDAIWGIYRLSSLVSKHEESVEDLCERAKGQGLFLAAEVASEKKSASSAEIRELYGRSGQLGHLYSYITLAQAILNKKVDSEDAEKEAFSYYQRADRPGFARGTRLIVGLPPSSFSEKLSFLLRMIDLNDIEGCNNLLSIYSNISEHRSQIDKELLPRTISEIEEKYRKLLNERKKVFELIKIISQH